MIRTALLVRDGTKEARQLTHYAALARPYVEARLFVSSDGVHFHEPCAEGPGAHWAWVLFRQESIEGKICAKDIAAAMAHSFGGVCPACSHIAEADSVCDEMDEPPPLAARAARRE